MIDEPLRTSSCQLQHTEVAMLGSSKLSYLLVSLVFVANKVCQGQNKPQLIRLAETGPERATAALCHGAVHTHTHAHTADMITLILFRRCSHIAVMFTVFPTWTCVCVCCIFIECSVVRVFVLVYSIFDRSVIFWYCHVSWDTVCVHMKDRSGEEEEDKKCVFTIKYYRDRK